MFLLVWRGVPNNRFDAKFHDLKDVVEVLDTTDCVIERYTWEECLEINKKLRVNGINEFATFMLHVQTYFYTDSVLCGKISVRKTVSDSTQCYFNGETQLLFTFNYPVLRMVYFKDKKIDTVFSTDVTGSEGDVISDIWIQYAEKIQNFYRVAICLQLGGSSGVLNEYVLIYALFDYDAGFIKFEDVVFSKGLDSVFLEVNPKYDIGKALRAKLRIAR